MRLRSHIDREEDATGELNLSGSSELLFSFALQDKHYRIEQTSSPNIQAVEYHGFTYELNLIFYTAHSDDIVTVSLTNQKMIVRDDQNHQYERRGVQQCLNHRWPRCLWMRQLKNLGEKIQDEHKTTSDTTSPVNGIGRIVANPLQIILLKQCKTKG